MVISFLRQMWFLISVCHLLRSGVAALFGPQSGTTSSHVQSICDAMEIPHIETRWDYRYGQQLNFFVCIFTIEQAKGPFRPHLKYQVRLKYKGVPTAT